MFTIQEGIGQGGPIEGYDISVYHVVTDFKLGTEGTRDKIWPVCLPKNDREFWYSGRELKDGFIAGWLDTPPVSERDLSPIHSKVSSEFGTILCIIEK